MRTSLGRWMRFGLTFLLLGSPVTLLATPVQYQFELTVNQVGGFSNSHDYFAGCNTFSTTVFPCKPDGAGGGTPVLVGDTFLGRFTVEEDVASLADGAHLLDYSGFDVTVGMIRYSSPIGSAGCAAFTWVAAECWDGTRGYVGPIIGLGGSLAFVVTGGEITSLLGELHGPLDLPCLNFDAYRGAGNWIGYGMGDVMGSYSIHRVPEPGTLALLLIALLAADLARRRRESLRRRSPSSM